MKKAILNLGFLSIMMMLTSFNSNNGNQEMVLSHSESDYRGMLIPPGRKNDYKSNIPESYFESNTDYNFLKVSAYYKVD